MQSSQVVGVRKYVVYFLFIFLSGLLSAVDYFSNKTFLSFGIVPALLYYSVNFELEDLPENQDPAFSESTYSSLSFDIGSGVYIYNDKLSLGFSVANMLQSSFDGEVLVQSNQSFGKTSFGENLRQRIFFSSLEKV